MRFIFGKSSIEQFEVRKPGHPAFPFRETRHKPSLPTVLQPNSQRLDMEQGGGFKNHAVRAARPIEGVCMTNPHVEIYTKALCGYCHRAKMLLDRKGVAYDEYDITYGGPKQQEMMERLPTARTVPQIFIGGSHVGGCDDLMALERAGKLDTMLGI